jgi:hypothetical protein
VHALNQPVVSFLGGSVIPLLKETIDNNAAQAILAEPGDNKLYLLVKQPPTECQHLLRATMVNEILLT